MGDVAHRRDRRGECLGRVDAGRGELGLNAHADQQSARNLAESHAERAIDQLGGKADQNERDQCRRISEYRRKDIGLHPVECRDVPKARASGKRRGAAPRSRALAFAPIRT